MIKITFWAALIFLLYTYFGYPIVMVLLSGIKKRASLNKNDVFPFISIVISAYNEESAIGQKIESLLKLDYPKDKMEIYIVSDVSSDKTDEIVKSYQNKGITLFRLEKRSGKIGAYRTVLPHLKGEIIVFSDATSILNPDSVTKLIRNFNDPKVGCAGGLLKYVNPKNAMIGEGESKYWQYEKLILQLESDLDSLTSVSGTLYGVRKGLYPMDIADYLADDFIVPITVRKNGFHTVLEPDSICIEFTTGASGEEISKRSRITLQNILGLINQAEIMNLFKYGLYSFLIISHKLFRILVPVFQILLFTVSLILSLKNSFYLLILELQIIFYILGLAGYFCKNQRNLKTLNIPLYFCLSNIAILVGIIKFFKGERVATWNTVRENL